MGYCFLVDGFGRQDESSRSWGNAASLGPRIDGFSEREPLKPLMCDMQTAATRWYLRALVANFWGCETAPMATRISYSGQ
jgi:hypothetical protein